jgi:hypothetical protein
MKNAKNILKAILGIVVLLLILTAMEVIHLSGPRTSHGLAVPLNVPPPDTLVELPPPPVR